MVSKHMDAGRAPSCSAASIPGPIRLSQGLILLLIVMALSSCVSRDEKRASNSETEPAGGAASRLTDGVRQANWDVPEDEEGDSSTTSLDNVNVFVQEPNEGRLRQDVREGVWMIVAASRASRDTPDLVELLSESASALRGAVKVLVFLCDDGSTPTLLSEYGVEYDPRCLPSWIVLQDGILVGRGCGQLNESDIRRQMIRGLSFIVGSDKALLTNPAVRRVGPLDRWSREGDDWESAFRFFVDSSESGRTEVVLKNAPHNVFSLNQKARSHDLSEGRWIVLCAGLWSPDHFVNILTVVDNWEEMSLQERLGILLIDTPWIPPEEHSLIDLSGMESYEPIWVALEDGRVVQRKWGTLDRDDILEFAKSAFE